MRARKFDEAKGSHPVLSAEAAWLSSSNCMTSKIRAARTSRPINVARCRQRVRGGADHRQLAPVAPTGSFRQHYPSSNSARRCAATTSGSLWSTIWTTVAYRSTTRRSSVTCGHFTIGRNNWLFIGSPAGRTTGGRVVYARGQRPRGGLDVCGPIWLRCASAVGGVATA